MIYAFCCSLAWVECIVVTAVKELVRLWAKQKRVLCPVENYVPYQVGVCCFAVHLVDLNNYNYSKTTALPPTKEKGSSDQKTSWYQARDTPTHVVGRSRERQEIATHRHTPFSDSEGNPEKRWPTKPGRNRGICVAGWTREPKGARPWTEAWEVNLRNPDEGTTRTACRSENWMQCSQVRNSQAHAKTYSDTGRPNQTRYITELDTKHHQLRKPTCEGPTVLATTLTSNWVNTREKDCRNFPRRIFPRRIFPSEEFSQ